MERAATPNYYSNISRTVRTDEGDYDETTWVSHTGKVPHLFPSELLDYIRNNSVGHTRGRELDLLFGAHAQSNVPQNFRF